MLKRQGDILLERVDDAELRERKHIVPDGVIARGEVTGHAHRVEGGEIRGTTRGLAVVSDGSTKVTHEEHGPLELEEGIWLIHRQVEYADDDELVQVYD